LRSKKEKKGTVPFSWLKTVGFGQSWYLIKQLVQAIAGLKVEAGSLDNYIKDENKDQKGIDEEDHRFHGGDFLGNSLGEEDVESELSQNTEQDQDAEAQAVDVELGMGVIFWPNPNEGRNEPDGEEEDACGDCKPLDLSLADENRAHRPIRYHDSGRKYRELLGCRAGAWPP